MKQEKNIQYRFKESIFDSLPKYLMVMMDDDCEFDAMRRDAFERNPKKQARRSFEI